MISRLKITQFLDERDGSSCIFVASYSSELENSVRQYKEYAEMSMK
jgi:hypothetical protein